MDLGEQHDDHIWLTLHGEAWAIRSMTEIDEGDEVVFALWRGYEPHLENWMAVWQKEVWVYYSEFAAWMLMQGKK